MNILFIYSIWSYQSVVRPLKGQQEIQFGISYISSLLKSHGYNTELLVLTKETKREFIDKYIKTFSPNLICFTAVSTEYEFTSDIAKYIKSKYPSIYLLIGGPHASLKPEQILLDSFDALCIGEGEYPALELVRQLEKGKKPTQIKNLWIKDGDKIEINPTREFIRDLDNLPFPDRDIWQRWVKHHETRHVVFLGRGCLFQCTYCCNQAFEKLAAGNYVRFRSVDNIVKELKEIIAKFPKTREVYFETESIGMNTEFAAEFCSRLEKFNKDYGKRLRFGVNLRITAGMDCNYLFNTLKKANFNSINIGLESGSERVRNEVLKRYYSNQSIIQNVKLAKENGFKVYMFAMVGIPGETLADFKDTIKCVRECQPEWILLSIFYPYPGTVLYNLCKEKGLLNHKIDTRLERRRAVLDFPEFSKHQIKKQFIWFFYYVYKGYRPLLLVLGYVVFQHVRSDYILDLLYRKIIRYSFFDRLLSRAV